jgi:ABC-type transporter Mla MlaB component
MNLSLLPLGDDVLFRVRCSGPITLRGLPSGSEPLSALLGPNCFSHKILLDLSGALSIDTSGVVWLSRIRNAFQDRGGALVLHGIPPIVLDMLHVLRVTSLFSIVDTDAEARDRALDGPTFPATNHRVLPFHTAI